MPTRGILMRLGRLGPEGFHVVSNDGGSTRFLYSDPFETPPSAWRFGRMAEMGDGAALLPPIRPGKIVGVGRNYADHARELDNPVPAEPVLFLKSPSSVIGPNAPVLLPPESQRVEYEGEIALVLGRRICRAGDDEARAAILGVTAACDITARDLQRVDATFARAKSFDTFCPIGPFIDVDFDLESLEVTTWVDDEERQRGHVRDMLFDPVALLVYISRMMTLEPGDVVLTGTPAGVGPLGAGQRLRVAVSGVGTLENPVENARVTS